MITKIYIENELIDLFEDETIELNSAIADTEDITKINSDYTKTFTVPASERNNRIFKHYYNADIDNTFDARTKKNAYIELGGLPFRTGKIRLEKVSVKSGYASSYTINFWSNLINFKDKIKDDDLSVLDLSAYDHEFNSDNVKEGLVNGLFSDNIVYNLFSQRRQFLYDSTVTNNTNTNSLVNIYYNGVDRGVVWNELKPSIRLLAVIEAIEAKYDFMFSRDFFGRNEFKELYMWVNRQTSDKITVPLMVDFDSGDTDFVDLVTNTFTCQTYLNGASDGIRFKWRFSVTPSLGFENTPYTIHVYNNGDEIYQQTFTGTVTGFSGTLETVDLTTHNLTYFISSTETFSFNSSLSQQLETRVVGGWLTVDMFETEASEQTVLDSFSISNNLPKLKIIDFLKGLFNMFKLVAIPQQNGDIYINTIDDYYRNGVVYDITKYIDFASYDVNRGTLSNQIDFKYQDPTTILNKQFKMNTGIAYGDELLSLTDEDGMPLDGGSIEVTLPFEQLVFERLTNLNNATLSNIQYGLVLDDKLEPANPKPIIFYNNAVSLADNKLSFVNDLGNAEEINTTVNTPSHTLGMEAPLYSTLWGVEFSTWDYAAINGTLYFNYWNSYVSSIFNIKRRTFKYKAFLPVNILTKIQLNDLALIKGSYYRINDFTVNLLNGEASLNLINTFETNFGLFEPSQKSIYLNYKAQSYTVYVSNGDVMNIVLTNTGFGTSWATAIQTGTSIVITLTENTTEINRDLFIDVDNGAGKSFQIYLNQDNKVVTFDSTTITFDSELITFDAV